ncbi:MAG TPA: GNAT family N-acetyltransferase [Micromonosporaceae bacterium]
MADVLLSDGSTVHIRQIAPEDADRIVALHGRFSVRTRYLRYFSPYPRIPPRDLERFVTVDHRDREALVVTAAEQIIAVGRYERLAPDAGDAEVAFVVEDAFQGKGIGPLLLEHLAQAARSAGIRRFVAEVLPANRPMLKVLFEAGYQISREWAEGVVHLTFPIEPTPASESIARDRERHPEAASIARLLRPGSVVVYGVRRDGTGVGASLVHTIASGGFTGSLSVVHPTAPAPAAPGVVVSTLEGASAFPTASVAGGVDLAVVAVPAAQVPAAVADAGGAGAHAVVVISAGFADGPARDMGDRRELVALARHHGMRLVGPNCLGVINTDPAVCLNATLVPRMVARGRVGVFCQSGFVGVAMLSEIDERGLGVSTFASAGDRADVSGNDLLQYWRDDPHTDVVLLYLETFGNPHKFARIARELGRDKPVAMVAAGAAAGSVSGPDDLPWSPQRALESEAAAALIAHSGVIHVQTVPELLDVAQILASCPLPAGARVGVVGDDSALVRLAAATCARAGLEVTFTRSATPRLQPRVLKSLVAAALDREVVDMVLAVVSPPLPGSPVDDALYGIADAVDHHCVAGPQARIIGKEPEHPGPDKPVVTVLVATPSRVDLGLPTYRTVEEAVRALAHVSSYAAWRRRPPGTLPELAGMDSDAGRAVVARQGPVAELLAAYGIPSTVDWKATADGVECVVEVLDDPAFGPVVGFGVGGIATRLLGDRAWRVVPLTDVDAAALVRAPRAAALLQGYGGADPVDLNALQDLLLRVGLVAHENPGVKRLRLDPVRARDSGLVVVHASVVYGEPGPRPDTGPRHLG